MNLQNPVASDDVLEHADWLEGVALKSSAGTASLEDLVSVLRQNGSVDGLGDDQEISDDRGSVTSQGIANDAFAELQKRAVACGDNYPFDLAQGLLTIRKNAEDSVYVLLSLLSSDAPTSGHKGTATLFEHICTDAACAYFGGTDTGVNKLRFGAPRKSPLVKFHSAVDDLCVQIGEGGGCSDTTLIHHGDGGLDVVAWKDFPDKKVGKLIAFGQCAGGNAWRIKADELDGTKFIRKWIRNPFTVEPIRMFFVPRWIGVDFWRETGIDGGIVFDRGRITSLVPSSVDAIGGNWVSTAKNLLRKFRRT